MCSTVAPYNVTIMGDKLVQSKRTVTVKLLVRGWGQYWNTPGYFQETQFLMPTLVLSLLIM